MLPLSAVGAIMMIAGEGWFSVFGTVATALPWLYVERLRGAHIEFTTEVIRVFAILRWTRIATTTVTDIVLSPHPGIAYVVADDAGSAVVSLSALGYEVSRERSVREHDLEMLGRMYRDSSIRVSGTNHTRTLGMNRQSQAVHFRWIAPTKRELVIAVVVAAIGVVCLVL